MNLVQKLIEQSEDSPEKLIISQLLPKTSAPERVYQTQTYKEFFNSVVTLANYLRDLGITKGDKVAILSNTRPEWLIADFAIMFNGAASVSVYQTLTANEIAYLLYDSGSSVVIAENQEQLDKLLSLLDQELTIPEVEDRPAHQVRLSLKKIILLEVVPSNPITIELGDILSRPNSNYTHFKINDINESDLASIVYTSGTTGLPKGVVQTHGNHLANINQVLNSGILAKSPALFLFLPLAHSFAKLMAYLGLLTDCSLKFPSIDPKSSKFEPELLVQDIRDANANVFPIVPRILEKVEDKLKARANGKNLQSKLLALAIKSAADREHSFVAALLHTLLTPIRDKIKRGIFGNDLYFVVSGGAKLNAQTNLFFERLGISILQGYGLTETCVATNINRQSNNKIGTVGPVLDTSIEVKVAEDQEIIFRGPNVCQGYWKRPLATKESWKGAGWFHTGDLGSIDSEGFLSITGRKKEIIVTSYGKKTAPSPIEDKIKESKYIENAVLFGNDKPFIVALVVVNKNAVKAYCDEQGITLSNNYLAQKEIRDLIQNEINRVNKQLASYETIKSFALIDQDFSIENGYLTPTMKVKVSKVYQGYQDLIDRLYLNS